jgi:hypothetical protein
VSEAVERDRDRGVTHVRRARLGIDPGGDHYQGRGVGALVQCDGLEQLDALHANPDRGNLAPTELAALSDRLSAHTATAEDWHFCLSEGYGGLERCGWPGDCEAATRSSSDHAREHHSTTAATAYRRGASSGRNHPASSVYGWPWGWEGLPTPAGAEPPNLRSRRTEPLSERVLSVLRVLKAGHELLVSAGVL